MSLSKTINEMSRRDLIKGAAAGAAAITSATLPQSASAKAARTNVQAPGYYRRKVGDIEVTAVLDGTLSFDQPTLLALIAKASPDAVKPLNDKYFVPASGKLSMPINAYVINTGDKLILVDTGAAAKFGPTAGTLPLSMAAAGFDPAAIDAVVLTHAHPDHAAGLITATGEAVFPNAELILTEVESKFWMDPATRARLPSSQQGFIDVAAASLKPYATRTTLIADGAEIAPGMSSLALPGHTPGHTGYAIASGNDRLLLIGDTVALYEWLFDKPDWSLAFDVEADTAVATRKRLFDMASADKLLIAGAHMPFPGFGYVGREGSAYRFVPAPWSLL